MQLTPYPEIDEAALKAVRQFLTSVRDEEHKARAPRIVQDAKGMVTLRLGIARARQRSGAKAPS